MRARPGCLNNVIGDGRGTARAVRARPLGGRERLGIGTLKISDEGEGEGFRELR